MTESQNKYPTKADFDALNILIRKANQGPPEAIRELQQFLDERPQIWNKIGDVAKISESAWITLIANGDCMLKESLKKKLAVLKDEILDGSTHIFDQMLAEVIQSTWLELHYLLRVDADATNRTAGQSTLMMKRLESAQRRHTSAIKQYCQIKKLLPGDNRQPDIRIFQPRQDSA
jgi:hypothetical protein